uniref:Fibronectin type-III domain-containing protein n=1 Tax=Megaselia scalaris TaxID=36166 RepID=T1GEB8_MEGSC
MYIISIPAPKQLTLERQLNKSVLISWTSGEPVGYNTIESYHVYVDGVLKVTVKANEHTRALIEGVDSTRPHRISVRSVLHNRQTSRDAACTMIIGRDTSHLGPSAVRASHITCSQPLFRGYQPIQITNMLFVSTMWKCEQLNQELIAIQLRVYHHLLNTVSRSGQNTYALEMLPFLEDLWKKLQEHMLTLGLFLKDYLIRPK